MCILSESERDAEDPGLQMCVNQLTGALVEMWFGIRAFHSGISSLVPLLNCEGLLSCCAAAGSWC